VGVSVAVGVAVSVGNCVGVPVAGAGGSVAGRNGVRVKVALADVGMLAAFPGEAAQPVNNPAMSRMAARSRLIPIGNLDFQAHLPDGLQQRSALLETRLAQVAQAQVDAAAAAAQQPGDEARQRLLVGCLIVGVAPGSRSHERLSTYGWVSGWNRRSHQPFDPASIQN
jgi:hypothetical protein